MKIIRPTSITDDLLGASTVPEDDYDEWAETTVYNLGDRCIVTTPNVHRRYESLQDANTGNYPPDTTTGDTPWWLDLGPTNRWAAYDQAVETQTIQDGSISYTLTPGRIDSIAILNVDATELQITMTDPSEGEVYNTTIDLIATSNVIDAYTYCFEPILQTTDVVLFDLPPYSAATLVITLSSEGTVKCGAIIMGLQYNLGTTLRSSRIGITDYSTKEVDAWGNYQIVPRAYARRGSYEISIPNDKVDEIYRVLAQYRSTAVVWVGIPGKSATYSYGYYRDYEMLSEGQTRSEYMIELLGLT